jgi:hypothetical protein
MGSRASGNLPNDRCFGVRSRGTRSTFPAPGSSLSRGCRAGACESAGRHCERRRQGGSFSGSSRQGRRTGEPGRAPNRRRRPAATARPARTHPRNGCADRFCLTFHPRQRERFESRESCDNGMRRAGRRGDEHGIRAFGSGRYASAPAFPPELGQAELRARRNPDSSQRRSGLGSECDPLGQKLGRRRGGLGGRAALRRAGENNPLRAEPSLLRDASAASPGTTSPPTSSPD